RQKCSLPHQEGPHHLWGGRGDFPEGVEPAISQKGWNRRFPRRGGRGDFPEGVEPAISQKGRSRRLPRRGGTGNSRRRTGLRTRRERRFEPQSAGAKPKNGNPGSSDASTKVLSRQLLLRPIAASLPLPHGERTHDLRS